MIPPACPTTIPVRPAETDSEQAPSVCSCICSVTLLLFFFLEYTSY